MSEYPDPEFFEDEEDLDELFDPENAVADGIMEAALEFATDGESGEIPLPEGQEPPQAPYWNGESLIVPQRWKGQLSEIQFVSQHRPNGTVIAAEIPGEFPSLVSVLCSDPEGLLDVAFAIDAGVSVASEPEAVPKEFLIENSMALHTAATIFEEVSERIAHSMDDTFRSPDQAELYDLQKSSNDKVAKKLMSISQRLRDTLSGALPGLMNSASLAGGAMDDGMFTHH